MDAKKTEDELARVRTILRTVTREKEAIQDKLAECQADLKRERQWRKELQKKDQALRRRKASKEDWYKKWAKAKGPLSEVSEPEGKKESSRV